jgi:hypothetical protein
MKGGRHEESFQREGLSNTDGFQPGLSEMQKPKISSRILDPTRMRDIGAIKTDIPSMVKATFPITGFLRSNFRRARIEFLEEIYRHVFYKSILKR